MTQPANLAVPADTHDLAGRPLRCIGGGEIDPHCLENYRALYPERSGAACNGDPYSITAAPARQQRGFGASLGYRYSNNIS
jgi:hypothetical protein